MPNEKETDEAAEKRKLDDELDQQLEQTFPPSDPLKETLSLRKTQISVAAERIGIRF